MGQIIKCNFNLFQEGRKYTGHHRTYILESAIKTCYAPETREGLKLREKLGYFGHGRREMARKVAIAEVEPIKLPDGSTILTENIPSNVTVGFEVDKNGNVDHSQELLDTEPGKVVAGLNASKVGGFSWACGGSDGGSIGATRLTTFQGFDYVMNPGFSMNRGYILESADGATADLILENICKATGLDDKGAENVLRQWVASSVLENASLQDQLEQAAIYEDALREDLETRERGLRQTTESLTSLQKAAEKRKALIMECASKSIVVVPQKVLDAMIGMADASDFDKLVGYFESASRVDLKGLPIGEHTPRTVKSKPTANREDAEFGSAGSAVDFEPDGLKL